MSLDIKELIKKNGKFLLFMLFIIIFGLYGISYALKYTAFDKINANISTSNMVVNINFDDGSEISNDGNLFPVSDEIVTYDVTDSRVLKVKFDISGDASNPSNSIYDIVIRDLDMDCELRSSDVKWRLYKNGSLLYSGSFSPSFDVISNGRLVLTETQQDLTTNSDEYVFLLWISDSCTDIMSCSSDQSMYMNKSLTGSIKIEMAAKSKKVLTRSTNEESFCKYIVTNTPSCNILTYNGSDQVMISEGVGYSLKGNIGNLAGEYNVTAMLQDGYSWSDGSFEDKFINCSIGKKSIIVKADDQSISYGGSIDNSKYTVTDLVLGHSVDSIYLTQNRVLVGIGDVIPTKIVIVDSNGNDVTDSYDILFKKGTLTITD